MRWRGPVLVLTVLLLAHVQAVTYFLKSSKYVRPNIPYDVDVDIDPSITEMVLIKVKITGRTSYRSPQTEISASQATFRKPHNTGQITLNMDKLTGDFSQASLTIEGSGGVTFNETKSLQVESKTKSTFIQTDKAIYKPGQTIKFRVVAVDSNLKPYTGLMDIEIFDAKKNKIKSLKNQETVTSRKYGVFSGTQAISDQPNQGMWKIKVTAGKETAEVEVEIAEYVLPKFEVSIEAPPYKLFDNQGLTITVVAKYTFGQPVKGSVTVFIDLDYHGNRYYGVKKGMLARQLTLKNGRGEFHLEDAQILEIKFEPDSCYPKYLRAEAMQCHIDAYRGDGAYMPPTTIKVMANVTEALTDITLSGEGTIKIETNSLKIDVLPITPSNFKPGQQYMAMFELKQPDNKPLDSSYLPLKMAASAIVTYEPTPNERGEIERYARGETETITIGEFNVAENGIVIVPFDVPPKTKTFNLVANVTDPKTLSQQRKFLVTRKYNIGQFESGSNATLQLLMANGNGAVQPGKMEAFLVKSTKEIPGNFNYVILSKGVVVTSGMVSASSSLKPMSSDSNMHQYEFSINFTPTLAQSTSPSARIVVYYITPAGKLLVDTIDFNVEGGIANKVSCAFGTNLTEPATDVGIRVTADPDSLVLLSAVDTSTSLAAGGKENGLTEDMVLAELKTYDASNKYITPFPFWRGGWADRRKKRSICYGCWWPITTGGSDTSEVLDRAGLCVFTDAYIHKKEDDYSYDESGYLDGVFAPRAAGVTGAPARQGQQGHHFHKGTGQSLQRRDPTRKGQPSPLCPFEQNFLRLGSGLMKLLGYDYDRRRVYGSAGVGGLYGRKSKAGPAGSRGQAGLPGERGMRGPVGPSGAHSPPGSAKPVTMRKEFPETWIWINDMTGPDGRVELMEKAPDTITSWILSAWAVNGQSGLGVAPNPSTLTVFKPFFVSLTLPYSVIMGEEFNLKITVFNYMKVKQEVTVTLTNADNFFKAYKNGVMNGEQPAEGDVLKKVMVAAGDGNTVNIWIKPSRLGQVPIKVIARGGLAQDGVLRNLLVKPPGSTEESAQSVLLNMTGEVSEKTLSFDVDIPREAEFFVRGSEYIKITAIGDIMGQALANLGNLVKMPYGCGEQNMVNFAPNIFVRKYLETTSRLTQVLVDKTKLYMESGYQREMSYHRTDGGFSAFGDRDKSGSSWLTALVIKSFEQAREFITIDEEVIKKSANFIIRNQNSDGSYNEPGSVHNSRLVGGATSNGKVALTAYILIALTQNKNILTDSRFQASAQLAQKFLEDRVQSIAGNSYTLAITYYALSMRNSSATNELKALLLAKAKIDDGNLHFEDDQKPEPPASSRGWRPRYHQARSTDIEMTAYALMALLRDGDLERSLQIVKWLVRQQNAFGGYASTQDTIIGLQALSEFAEKTYGALNCVSDSLDVSVTPVSKTSSDTKSFLPIARNNALVLQSIELPKDTTQVSITTRQCGFAMVQLQYQWNVMEAEEDKSIDITVDSLVDKFKQVIVNACTKWLKEDEESGMSVVEVFTLSGYDAKIDGLLDKYASVGLKRLETEISKLVLYLDEIPRQERCFSVPMEKVNDVSNLQESKVSVYSYYQPEKIMTKLYLPSALRNIQPCEACPTCCERPDTPVFPGRPTKTTRNVGGASMVTATLMSLVLTLATTLLCVV